ncbi:MAG: cytochrome c oxidase subunit 3, partial [Gemmatimonadota bacterium]|nr:cytochrome c oxidase subunit 3 [Gemmatimonadota bacterium]
MMTRGATATDVSDLPINPTDHRSPGWWGMVLVICTEAAFFAYFIFSYFYLASMAQGSWPPGGPPALTLALPNTAILLLSSVSLWWGESGIRRGSQSRLRIGLFITLVLGVTFLIVQGVEYRHKHFTPATDAYASLFFSITGFHGAHVGAGLLMNIVVQVRAWLGHFSAERHLAVSNAALYWHFV